FIRCRFLPATVANIPSVYLLASAIVTGQRVISQRREQFHTRHPDGAARQYRAERDTTRRYSHCRPARRQHLLAGPDSRPAVMRSRYLRPSLELPEIYLYRQPVDFRKQANGLALIVEQELGHSPFSGALYAFTNRQRNKIKCLLWEDNGFILYYKALAEERFKWPGPSDALLTLTGEQINWLLGGNRPNEHVLPSDFLGT